MWVGITGSESEDPSRSVRNRTTAGRTGAKCQDVRRALFILDPKARDPNILD